MSFSVPRVVVGCDRQNEISLLAFCGAREIVWQPIYGRFLFTGYSVQF